jgi:hypothetical protein
MNGIAAERRALTLLCLADEANDTAESFYVLPPKHRTGNLTFTHAAKWLRKGIRLSSVSELEASLQRI